MGDGDEELVPGGLLRPLLNGRVKLRAGLGPPGETGDGGFGGGRRYAVAVFSAGEGSWLPVLGFGRCNGLVDLRRNDLVGIGGTEVSGLGT